MVDNINIFDISHQIIEPVLSINHVKGFGRVGCILGSLYNWIFNLCQKKIMSTVKWF